MSPAEIPGQALADADYPALYLAADRAARATQRRYTLVTAVILCGLVASALLSGFARVFPDWATPIAFAAAGLSALSFMLTTMRWSLKPEKRWYAARVVAETVKSMTWRFVTNASPYPSSLTADAAAMKFLDDLRATIQTAGHAALSFGSEFTQHRQITSRMMQMRATPLAVRRDGYVGGRIQDQRRWYGVAAVRNQRAATWFYIVIQISQAIGLGSSVLLLSPYTSQWDFAGVAAALASALLGWMHLRQYQDLAQSYAVAALDLGLTEERATAIASDADLDAFVVDAESTISRERHRWTARRE